MNLGGRAAAAIIILLGLATAGGAWVWLSRPPVRSYYDTRRLVILAHARQTADPVIILGDSVVDMAELPELCGQTVLNAGVSGARTAAVEQLARDVLTIYRPKLVIVAVGLNDAHRDAGTSDADFIQKYRAIVARARMTGADVRATTIPPVGPAGTGRADEFNRARIAGLNALIRQTGVPVLEVNAALANEDGIEPAVFTDDGVHPNARGYGVWKRVMAKACAV
ncbi:MAG TPA: GDSL-type esterase/lipase family protein [Sphingomonas sp.]|nr:GDSL-type esterase/lipase family protein [Sphingomonas sp.]